MEPTANLLVVEDDALQRDLLVSVLAHRGFYVTSAADGAGLRAVLAESEPDLVLLDVGLPDEDGISLARYVREQLRDVGIIIVSGARETPDRVLGLEVGADDYIVKPYEPSELVARIRSILRRVRARSAATADGTQVRMGRCVLDLGHRMLLDANGQGSGERLSLGEFDLLRTFAANPNRPLERDWLMEVTSHRERGAEDRSIDLRIARLRRKIEYNPSDPQAIRTVRGVGYMFAPD
jgi:two-component system phosphate regulon response regulator OmpR